MQEFAKKKVAEKRFTEKKAREAAQERQVKVKEAHETLKVFHDGLKSVLARHSEGVYPNTSFSDIAVAALKAYGGVHFVSTGGLDNPLPFNGFMEVNGLNESRFLELVDPILDCVAPGTHMNEDGIEIHCTVRMLYPHYGNRELSMMVEYFFCAKNTLCIVWLALSVYLARHPGIPIPNEMRRKTGEHGQI